MEAKFIGHQQVMNHFPKGCCQVASMFLAKYLVERNIIHPNEIALITNATKGHSSHAWLEANEHIVDITIDQFIETESFVFEMDSKFHKEFEGATKIKYQNFMAFNKEYENDFGVNYKQLIDA